MSPVPLDNLPRNVEADAQSWIGLREWFVDSIEPFEDAIQVGWGDADAEVLYAHLYIAFAECHTYDDALPVSRVFDRVGEQVHENLTDALFVPKDMCLNGLFQQKLVRLCRPLCLFDDLAYQFGQVKHLL